MLAVRARLSDRSASSVVRPARNLVQLQGHPPSSEYSGIVPPQLTTGTTSDPSTPEGPEPTGMSTLVTRLPRQPFDDQALMTFQPSPVTVDVSRTMPASVTFQAVTAAAAATFRTVSPSLSLADSSSSRDTALKPAWQLPLVSSNSLSLRRHRSSMSLQSRHESPWSVQLGPQFVSPPRNVLESQQPQILEQESDGNTKGSDQDAGEHQARPDGDTDLGNRVLDNQFRAMSLTPVPSTVSPKMSQTAKGKHKLHSTLLDKATPPDEPCLRCRQTPRKAARVCKGGGPTSACQACRTSKVACSKVGACTINFFLSFLLPHSLYYFYFHLF
jgi:hypothetical protein